MRAMKRSSSILICLGAAAVCWALTGKMDISEAPAAPPAIQLTPGSAAPSPVETVAVEPTATPEDTPAPAVTPADQVDEKAGTAPETKVDVTFVPEPSAPAQSRDPAQAGLVAGPEYDFSQPVPETPAVENDYFADAVFIGDSRTDGFRMFSGLDQGDYIVKTGLSVFKAQSEKIKVDGKKMTIVQALGRKEYGKVYICLGLNELGMYNDQGYYDHYAQLIDDVRAARPQATVYVQLLVPVNTQKCAEKGQPDYVNNEKIAVYNGLLYQLVQEKQVFLVDPAQALVDETGEPPYDTVADGVHFQKAAYQQWLDYLRRHTIDKGEWE